MIQLTLLSMASWGAWLYYYRPTPKSVDSITLLFAATAFSSLLLAHFVTALTLKLKRKGKRKQQPIQLKK